MGLLSSRSELILRPIGYRAIRPLSPSKRDRRRKNTRAHTRARRKRGREDRDAPSISATAEKDTREGGRASTEAGSGGRGYTLTHRHKINTFFSLHRRPGDNHEIMWPTRARAPPKCVAAVAVCYNPPPTRKTIPERCHLLCVATLSTIIRNVYVPRFRYRLHRIDRRRGRRGLRQ